MDESIEVTKRLNELVVSIAEAEALVSTKKGELLIAQGALRVLEDERDRLLEELGFTTVIEPTPVVADVEREVSLLADILHLSGSEDPLISTFGRVMNQFNTDPHAVILIERSQKRTIEQFLELQPTDLLRFIDEKDCRRIKVFITFGSVYYLIYLGTRADKFDMYYKPIFRLYPEFVTEEMRLATGMVVLEIDATAETPIVQPVALMISKRNNIISRRFDVDPDPKWEALLQQIQRTLREGRIMISDYAFERPAQSESA